MGQIDLHMHSNISLDGEYTPAELAGLCAGHHLTVAALADHNSVRGVAEMKKEAERLGVQVIPAVELDCTCRGLDLHLLGYGIEIEDKRYEENENAITAQKRSESEYMMQVLPELGVRFERDEVMKLAKDGIVVGEMIAEAALQDESNRDNPLLAPYRSGGARSGNPFVNFFWDFCSQGKPAFYPVRYPSFEEAAALIRETGGIPVLAHPAVTVGRREELLSYMGGMVDGIEVYSSYHTPEDLAYYREFAEKHGLIQTMGSDFHGKTKPSVRLGGTGGEDGESALMEELLRRKLVTE